MIELTYYTGKDCGVCQVLKPKLREAVLSTFSGQVDFKEVDVAENREDAAQNRVFTLPVVIIKLDGREVKRFVRAFGVHQVTQYLEGLISPIA
ncbi:thioredoxin family protein [Parvicella tangerina]|uniref:Thioredoxin domain-containing protein n=1 Tax=Parvicella tangerina TaxID=2829795 RepID=A0A916JP91_9FLAO|nr:thioredoxin family protein [Parvicella tangerina]CAG5085030.1 hypothetical protein CRYO30217_02629 [Parvicella tangerina]